MTYIRRTIMIALVGGLFVVLGLASTASAQTELSDEQLQQIRVNCLPIKNSLEQLHRSDAVLRVNRGQVYEYMATRLMDRFNTRLTSNSLGATQLTALTGTYRTTLDAFRASYRVYEEQLTRAIAIDCAARPAEFYASIQDARTKRAAVYSDVRTLHQYIDEYGGLVETFEASFLRLSSGDQL